MSGLPAGLRLQWYDFYDPVRESLGRQDIALWNAANLAVGGTSTFVEDYDAVIAQGPPVGIGVRTLLILDAAGRAHAAGGLWVKTRENIGDASLGVAVPPERWRQGLGAAVYREVERTARDLGLRRLSSWNTIAPGHPDHAPCFARAMGFRPTDEERTSSLPLPLAPEHLRTLEDDVAARIGPQHVIESVVSEIRPEWLEDLAFLHRRMSTDAPHVVQVEESDWDAERVRAVLESWQRAGQQFYLAVARHLPSGRLAGYSALSARPGDAYARQDDTLVLAEHRGHRLGLALKLETLRLLSAHRPEITSVQTGNARSNTPMLAVNDLMGFVETASVTGWLKEL